jgi:hypothetical protein
MYADAQLTQFACLQVQIPSELHWGAGCRFTSITVQNYLIGENSWQFVKNDTKLLSEISACVV